MNSDPTILEAAARAMMIADWNHEYGPVPEWAAYCRDYPAEAETYRILARAVTPLIRAAALEEAAQVVVRPSLGRRRDIEVVRSIRALKEQP